MTKRMLIDASHPEEKRVVVMQQDQLIDFDFESSTKKQLKGNVYLAKVTRVEPSLQAAFVDYGGNRHGFLAFSEIHPDYFQIPQADREILEDIEEDNEEDEPAADKDISQDGDENDSTPVTVDAEEETAEVLNEQAWRRAKLLRSYKIQEVIKRRQILLVQVVKEERGNKGAALTTYLSLAGRYCVLMPNTPRGGGISRKIGNLADRQRLKALVKDLEVPKGMGLIVRTAGQQRNKSEIRRDYDFLLKLWSEIRDTTLISVAPALIYEEGNLIKRAMRDMYTRDIEEVLVEGEEGYKSAKKLMQMMIPSRARRVKLFKEDLPLFYCNKVEQHLDAMHSPTVRLHSGGSIVIHTTEALTAVDVNSSRSTRERHIDETAVKTNLEAADEIARQLRLRDLAGLVVIDFIDMAENRHQRQVERRLREALKHDRARLQVGKISSFGLLELSRQRLRASLQELSSQICPTCLGLGVVRSTESCALQILRAVQEEGIKKSASVIQVDLPAEVALYVLNQKREALFQLEQQYSMQVLVHVNNELGPSENAITILAKAVEESAPEGENAEQGADVQANQEKEKTTRSTTHESEDEQPTRKRRRRRKKKRPEPEEEAAAKTDSAEPLTAAEKTDEEEVKEKKPGRRRRRRAYASTKEDSVSADKTPAEKSDQPVIMEPIPDEHGIVAALEQPESAEQASAGSEIGDDKGLIEAEINAAIGLEGPTYDGTNEHEGEKPANTAKPIQIAIADDGIASEEEPSAHQADIGADLNDPAGSFTELPGVRSVKIFLEQDNDTTNQGTATQPEQSSTELPVELPENPLADTVSISVEPDCDEPNEKQSAIMPQNWAEEQIKPMAEAAFTVDKAVDGESVVRHLHDTENQVAHAEEEQRRKPAAGSEDTMVEGVGMRETDETPALAASPTPVDEENDHEIQRRGWWSRWVK